MAVFQKKVAQLGTEPKPCDCSGQILCLPLYVSISIVTLTYIHTYIHTLRPRSSGRCCRYRYMDPRLSPKVMFRNPPGVTGQGYADKPFTYIHTYKHLFLHSSQAPTAIMGGGGCPSLPPTAEDAHALGDTSPSMGGAQQEVFNFFFTIHDEVNTPTI